MPHLPEDGALPEEPGLQAGLHGLHTGAGLLGHLGGVTEDFDGDPDVRFEVARLPQHAESALGGMLQTVTPVEHQLFCHDFAFRAFPLTPGHASPHPKPSPPETAGPFMRPSTLQTTASVKSCVDAVHGS
ncbi:hypothetical protein GCM10010232_43410 [Streptomyces amakusaensis]